MVRQLERCSCILFSLSQKKVGLERKQQDPKDQTGEKQNEKPSIDQTEPASAKLEPEHDPALSVQGKLARTETQVVSTMDSQKYDQDALVAMGNRKSKLGPWS